MNTPKQNKQNNNNNNNNKKTHDNNTKYRLDIAHEAGLHTSLYLCPSNSQPCLSPLPYDPLFAHQSPHRYSGQSAALLP